MSVAQRRVMLKDQLDKRVIICQKLCDKNPGSIECQLAWEELEEVTSALYREMQKPADALSELCESDPGHVECREYDV